MRSLFLFGLGILSGVIATVLLFSLDTDFSSDPEDAAVGGNARLVFDEAGLESLIKSQLMETPGFDIVTDVHVVVEEEGVIRVTLRAGGPAGVGLKGDLVGDPNIVDGKLKVDVVQASLGELGLPDPVANIIERELSKSLDALDPGVDYRLVSITTTNHELGLEVEI